MKCTTATAKSDRHELGKPHSDPVLLICCALTFFTARWPDCTVAHCLMIKTIKTTSIKSNNYTQVSPDISTKSLSHLGLVLVFTQSASRAQISSSLSTRRLFTSDPTTDQPPYYQHASSRPRSRKPTTPQRRPPRLSRDNMAIRPLMWRWEHPWYGACNSPATSSD
jgi:hypothetical protein